MDTTDVELAVAILTGVIFLILSSMTPMRVAVGGLLILAPFHVVEELGITNSAAMVYMVAIGLMLGGKRLKIPMFGCMLLVILGYMLSITQVHPSLYRWHGVYLIILASGFVMFTLCYNLGRNSESGRSIANLLFVSNVVVNIYCLVQLVLGPSVSASLLGLESLAIEGNRGEGDPRLGGPFGGAPGILAEYLALMTVIVIYDSIQSDRIRRRNLWILAAINLGLIVATANRGGFLTLLVGAAGLLIIFRKELGIIRITQIAATGVAFLVLASVVVIKTTEYNIMFNRLQSVGDMEGGIPNTRQQIWPMAWERFTNVPWFGQGPTWRLPMEHLGALYPGRFEYMDYPHSLYLYLLVTVGIVGTCAFLVFFAVLMSKLLKAARAAKALPGYDGGLVRITPLLLLLFLLDEIRIEFLRPTFGDYQLAVFGIFGLLLGLGRRVSAQVANKALVTLAAADRAR